MNQLPKVLQREIWEYVQGDHAYWKRQFRACFVEIVHSCRADIYNDAKFRRGYYTTINVHIADQRVNCFKMKRNWKVTMAINDTGHRQEWCPDFKFPKFVDALHKFQQQVTHCALRSLDRIPFHKIWIYKFYHQGR